MNGVFTPNQHVPHTQHSCRPSTLLPSGAPWWQLPRTAWQCIPTTPQTCPGMAAGKQPKVFQLASKLLIWSRIWRVRMNKSDHLEKPTTHMTQSIICQCLSAKLFRNPSEVLCLRKVTWFYPELTKTYYTGEVLELSIKVRVKICFPDSTMKTFWSCSSAAVSFFKQTGKSSLKQDGC